MKPSWRIRERINNLSYESDIQYLQNMIDAVIDYLDEDYNERTKNVNSRGKRKVSSRSK